MFDNLTIFLALLWIASGLHDYANFLYWWQLKEYRLDKFKDLLSTKQGREYWLRYSLLIQFLAVTWFLISSTHFGLEAKHILVFLLCINVSYGVFSLLKRMLRRPIITPKILLIFFTLYLFEGTVLYITQNWTVGFLLLIIRMFTTPVVVAICNVPTAFAKKTILHLATKKMQRYKDFKVVGITGSYGKSTVKEFLSHILSCKYNIIKTPKNINTEIGVALFILKNDFKKYDVFVVEMGAYKVGDIQLICDIVKPTYGILTAINEQHLSLFGTIQNTQKAKYELLYSLPDTGVAITNADNPYCRELLPTLNCAVDTFGIHEEFEPTLLISNIEENKKEGVISCQNTINGKTFDYTTGVPGRHNTKNIAACMLLAYYFDMTHEELRKQVETLKLPEKNLQIYKYHKAIIIDDSANSNPDGFKAALDVLSSYSGKNRIVITRGMHELGERSDALHEEVGGEIDFIANTLVLTKNNFAEQIESGMSHKYKTEILKIYTQDELLKYVKSQKNRQVVILIENVIPALVLEEIKSTRKK